MQGRVMIVAGSDSGGGAGIQADIKTVTCLGGFASTAITALTAQNTLGVQAVHEVPCGFIHQQMQVVLDDLGADCIKTGMLASAAIVETVAKALDSFAPGVPVVVDPVMVAKGGAALLAQSAMGALVRLLLPRARVLTPNIPEAEALLGRSITDLPGMEQAARDLLAMGPAAILLKGGHMDGDDLVDVLVDGGGVRHFRGRRIDSRSTHGTGCTLASAIAAGLAQGVDLDCAVARAVAYVRQAIVTAPGLGLGHGPLNHAHTVAPLSATGAHNT